MLIKADDYGYYDNQLWLNEKHSFCIKTIQNIIGYSLDDPVGYIMFCITYNHVVDMVISNYKNNGILKKVEPNEKGFSNYEKGRNYEYECIAELKKLGWDILQTPASNDKGVDIIALKDGLKIAFQCKNWSSKAGISSIQEVYTGVSYYNADFGVVLSETGVTSQANDVARNLKIFITSLEKIELLETSLIKFIKRYL